jgi:hypothetical protein
MYECTSLLTPFWKFFDVVLVLIGAGWIVRPSALLELFTAELLPGAPGRRLRFPPLARATLFALIERRVQALYDQRLPRIVGVVLVLVGLVGLITPIREAILVSALIAVSVAIVTAAQLAPNAAELFPARRSIAPRIGPSPGGSSRCSWRKARHSLPSGRHRRS